MKKKLIIYFLMVFSVLANADNASIAAKSGLSSYEIQNIKDGLAFFKSHDFSNYKNGKYRITNLRAKVGVEGNEFLDIKYGKLSNNIVNLRVPTSSINVSMSWSNLLYNSDMYLWHSKDVYEYYYRIYQLMTLRMYYISDNGRVVFNGEQSTGLSYSFINATVESIKYFDYDMSYDIIKNIYTLGNRKFVQKAFFNYILFSGSYLNKLSRSSYCDKYFSKFQRDWGKTKKALKLIKNETTKNDKLSDYEKGQIDGARRGKKGKKKLDHFLSTFIKYVSDKKATILFEKTLECKFEAVEKPATKEYIKGFMKSCIESI